MKTPFPLAIGIILLPFVSMTAQTPATLAQPPVITVSGTADVKVVPDEVHLNLAIETRSDKLEDAKRQNDERIGKVLQFLKGQGIKDKDVQTDFMTVEPLYDSKISRSEVVTYLVRKTIGARLTDISKFDAVLTGLLENGVNQLSGIEFSTSSLRKHRDEARAMAIRAAREKADALAAELGVKRGKAYNITSIEGGGWSSARGMMQNVNAGASGGSAGTGGTLAVGQISVTATVNVSFLIE